MYIFNHGSDLPSIPCSYPKQPLSNYSISTIPCNNTFIPNPTFITS